MRFSRRAGGNLQPYEALSISPVKPSRPLARIRPDLTEVPRIETLRLGIDQAIDFRGAFRRAVDAKMDAMLVHSSPIFVDEAAVIAELGREFRLPSIGLFPIYTKVGGFISHGPDNFELLKQVGGIVGKILRGAKPAEFPIQRPVYLSFLINMHTDCLAHHSSVTVSFGGRGDRIRLATSEIGT